MKPKPKPDAEWMYGIRVTDAGPLSLWKDKILLFKSESDARKSLLSGESLVRCQIEAVGVERCE